MDNEILLAVRENPKIFRQIIDDPANHLNKHRISIIEYMALDNITRQAFGKRRFKNACDNRQRTYRNWLDKYERYALRKEVYYMENSYLKGFHLYEEIAKLMTAKFKARFTWQDVKVILEDASEIIADLELHSNTKLAMVA